MMSNYDFIILFYFVYYIIHTALTWYRGLFTYYLKATPIGGLVHTSNPVEPYNPEEEHDITDPAIISGLLLSDW